MGLFTRQDLELFHPAKVRAGEQPPPSKVIEELGPKLTKLAKVLANYLTKDEGLFLFPHTAHRMAGQSPKPGFADGGVELMAAIAKERATLEGKAYLAIGLSHGGAHVHVVVPPECEQLHRIGGALRSMSANLARHHAYFGTLRQFAGWDGMGLPEVAPIRSAAFWDTLGFRFCESCDHWMDLGISWPSHEIDSLERDSILRNLKRLLSLYRMAVEDGYRPILR